MVTYPLLRCWLGMIALLFGSVCGAYPPSCDDISKTSITSVKSWSSCTPVDETDGSAPGCYSGTQQRMVEFASNSSIRVSSRKRQTQCLEYRRCLVPGRRCEGVWSLWKESTCNCLTKSKTQTRYCYRRTGAFAPESNLVRSMHCLGSSGRFESNRTFSCKPEKDDCEPRQRNKKVKPTEESTIAKYLPTSSTKASSSEWATTRNKSDYATTKLDERGDVAQVVAPTLESRHLVAIAVGGVSAILVVISAILFWQKRRAMLRGKDERRNSATNSQHTEEMAVRPQIDEPCYARNDLYQDSAVNADRERDLPPIGTDTVVPSRAGETRPSILQANSTTWTDNDEDIYWSIVT